MAKFAMYLVRLDEDGELSVQGSNDVEEIGRFISAHEYDQFLIIHTTYGDVQIPGKPTESIGELPLEDEDEDEDEDDD